MAQKEKAENKKQLLNRPILLIAALTVAVIILVGVLGFQVQTSPSYTFKTGVNHPQEIGDLIKNGTVVLYFIQDNCQSCAIMTPKIAHLQSQYPNVTFVSFRYEDTGYNSTVSVMFANYEIRYLPTVIVIRSDGASAKFIGETDINTVKNAIEDAQNWTQSPLTSKP